MSFNTGFRGSPKTTELDFVRGGQPVSAIVVGDNGSGKSSIVDAIEFALQGRIGRSIAFDSPLGPAVSSLATRDGIEVSPFVEVTLDDGSVIPRQLERRGDGVLRPNSSSVRPGFRLAPITLKRQDILRFLDTEALARGHVFFDYFPAKVDEMAVRPEQQVEMLGDEEYKLRVERTRLSESVGELLGVNADLVTAKDKLLDVVRARLTDGLGVNAAIKSGRWLKIDEAIRRPVEDLLGVQNRLRAIRRMQERGPETLNPMRNRDQAAVLARALEGIGDELTGAFRLITGAEYVEKIDVVFGRSGPVALDVVIELSTGKRCFPQQLFSEGYRDLLAVLFFTSVAHRAATEGQAKVLILDDVFQSVDAGIRRATVDYLIREFKGWQLIFTVHDRLWFEQLREAFARHSHPYVERELRRWTFSGGITVAVAATLTTALERQLELGDPGAICGASGLLLEEACDQLSGRLGARVVRRPGDKYTLGDLWPTVRKECRRTTIDSICERVDALWKLRNLAGAHYNEWARSLPLEEASRFGEAVLEFVGATWCDECRDWVAKKDDRAITCRCGGRSL